MIPEERRVKDILYLTRESFKVAQVDEPEKEALFLIAHYFGCKPMEVHLNGEQRFSEAQYRDLSYAIRRRFKHEPHQYIVGSQEFYGYPFKVGPEVLIPRPETELLVDEILSAYKTTDPGGRLPLILDLCTGCGVIAVALAKEMEGVRVIATDISKPAIGFAEENARALDVSEKVEFLTGDLFGALDGYCVGVTLKKDCSLTSASLNNAFDVIVSNPPYVTHDELATLATEIKDYEPHSALLGGIDGLDSIKRIVSGAGRYLRGGGLIAIEVGHKQANAVLRLIEDTGTFTELDVKKDLAGIDRVVTARRVEVAQGE